MSLAIHDNVKKTLRISSIVFLILLVAAFIRVAVWEHFYYKDKEGAPRAAATTPFTEEDAIIADESEVTESMRRDHHVAPDKPRYLSIDKLSVYNARILEVSAEDGQPMGVPINIADVGWALGSGKPGQGGTILLDGHNGGPTLDGVFHRLDSLTAGDIVTIERGDGQLFYYSVTDVKSLKLNDANSYMKTLQTTPTPGRESISLISCTGNWIQSAKTYDSRVMIRATIIE